MYLLSPSPNLIYNPRMPPLNPPQTFETQRLRLRQPKLTDAPDIFNKYTQDEEVTQYNTWKPHTNLEETKQFVQTCVDNWGTGKSFPWVIEDKTTQDLMGMIEIHPDDFKVSLGYVLARTYWGNGYMTEAAQSVVNWLLAQPHIFRVWAVTDVENRGSARVLKKIGMQYEGTLRRWIRHVNISDEPRDALIYAIVK